MPATPDDLRQPTCTEALSPAMRHYLHDRISLATGHTEACRMRLYQCVSDDGSARALAEDLLEFASSKQPQAFAAVFECPPQPTEFSFARTLKRHLGLMSEIEPRIRTLHVAEADAAAVDDEFRLRVLDHELHLTALHPDAGRLSRVLPCPVLLFQRLHA